MIAINSHIWETLDEKIYTPIDGAQKEIVAVFDGEKQVYPKNSKIFSCTQLEDHNQYNYIVIDNGIRFCGLRQDADPSLYYVSDGEEFLFNTQLEDHGEHNYVTITQGVRYCSFIDSSGNGWLCVASPDPFTVRTIARDRDDGQVMDQSETSTTHKGTIVYKGITIYYFYKDWFDPDIKINYKNTQTFTLDEGLGVLFGSSDFFVFAVSSHTFDMKIFAFDDLHPNGNDESNALVSGTVQHDGETLYYTRARWSGPPPVPALLYNNVTEITANKAVEIIYEGQGVYYISGRRRVFGTTQNTNE